MHSMESPLGIGHKGEFLSREVQKGVGRGKEEELKPFKMSTNRSIFRRWGAGRDEWSKGT